MTHIPKEANSRMNDLSASSRFVGVRLGFFSISIKTKRSNTMRFLITVKRSLFTGSKGINKKRMLSGALAVPFISGVVCASPLQEDKFTIDDSAWTYSTPAPASAINTHQGTTSHPFSEFIPYDHALAAMSAATALESVIDTPENYSRLDLYYVLWKAADSSELSDMANILHDSAFLIQLYLDEGTTVNSPVEDPHWPTLATLLTELYHGLINQNPHISRLIKNTFDCLHDATDDRVMDEIARLRSTNKERCSELYAFLKELSGLSAYSRSIDSEYFLNTPFGYASNRVWLIMDHAMKDYQPTFGETHTLHVVRLSTLALYMLYLGETEQAYRIMSGLQEIEPAYKLGDHEMIPWSIINWIVYNTLHVIHNRQQPQLKTSFINALLHLIKIPHFSQVPQEISRVIQPSVLLQLRSALIPLVGTHSFEEPYKRQKRQGATH